MLELETAHTTDLEHVVKIELSQAQDPDRVLGREVALENKLPQGVDLGAQAVGHPGVATQAQDLCVVDALGDGRCWYSDLISIFIYDVSSKQCIFAFNLQTEVTHDF